VYPGLGSVNLFDQGCFSTKIFQRSFFLNIVDYVQVGRLKCHNCGKTDRNLGNS
jgi:hypothetical protein